MFSLHAPSMLPFMQYADQRELREQLFRASTKRGNQDNQNDNKANILRQAELRLAKAQLLGYRSHADYVLEERMAQSADKVNRSEEHTSELQSRPHLVCRPL